MNNIPQKLCGIWIRYTNRVLTIGEILMNSVYTQSISFYFFIKYFLLHKRIQLISLSAFEKVFEV